MKLLWITGIVFHSLSCFGNNPDSLLSLLDRPLSDSVRVNVLNQLSEHLKPNDPNLARTYALNALELANRNDYDKGFADAAVNLGDISRIKGIPEAAQYYAHAIDIYKNGGHIEQAAKTSNKAGVAYLINGDYLNAEETFTECLELYRALKDTSSIAGVLHNLGNVNYLKGKFGKALEQYYQALQLRTDINDKKGESGTLTNIGNVYNQQNRLEQALEYYQKSRAIKEAIDDPRGLATVYNNIGSILHKQSNQDEALLFFKKAFHLNDSLNHKAGKSETLTNIGQVYSEQKNYTLALEHYFKALEIANQSNNPYAQTHIYLSLGKTNSRMGNHPQAINYLKKASQLSRSISATEEIKLVEEALAAAYERAGNHDKALYHYKNFSLLKDSLFNKEIAQNIAELEMDYNREQTTRQLEILRKENEVNELTINKNRILLFSSLTVSLLVIGLLLLFLVNFRKNQKTNRILSIQNRDILRQKEEKEALLKEVHHRVKNNLQIINSLLRLQSNYISDPTVHGYFHECQSRVYAMALIHEKLYETEDLSKVSILAYVNTLVENLLRSYGLSIPIKTKVNAEDVVFPVNMLIPIALILNEIVSNSLKYAFRDMPAGEIRIDIQRDQRNVHISICDNGPGYAEEKWKNPETLGLDLVKTFVDQLEGSISMANNEGTRYEITFPLSS